MKVHLIYLPRHAGYQLQLRSAAAWLIAARAVLAIIKYGQSRRRAERTARYIGERYIYIADFASCIHCRIVHAGYPGYTLGDLASPTLDEDCGISGLLSNAKGQKSRNPRIRKPTVRASVWSFNLSTED